MGILKNLFSKKQEAKAQPPQEEPKRPKGIIKTQRHKLENVEAHMKEIMELVEENMNYRKKPNFCSGGGAEPSRFLWMTYILAI